MSDNQDAEEFYTFLKCFLNEEKALRPYETFRGFTKRTSVRRNGSIIVVLAMTNKKLNKQLGR
jgi:hypothetical protein